MSKPPTRERGRRIAVAAPPEPTPRRSAWGRSDGSAHAPVFGELGWRAIAVFALTIFGLGDSIYLTLTHYTELVPLVCKVDGPINCLKVTTSPQSVIFGIPVAVYGLVFYFAMVGLCLPATWRRQTPRLAALRLGASTTGLGFVAYLLYTELYVIHAICLWCTAVHVATFLIFVVLATGWYELSELGRAQPEDAPDDDSAIETAAVSEQA